MTCFVCGAPTRGNGSYAEYAAPAAEPVPLTLDEKRLTLAMRHAGVMDQEPWPPVRRVTLNLPTDVGQALRERSLREERRVQIEATRLLRSALEASGDLPADHHRGVRARAAGKAGRLAALASPDKGEPRP